MKTVLSCILAWLVPLCTAQINTSGNGDATANLPTDWKTGIATYYGGAPDGLDPYTPSFGTSVGGCGYGRMNKTVWPYWSVGALSTKNSYYLAGPVDACGQCFELECVNDLPGSRYAGRCGPDPNQRSITFMVSDACPECEADHVDLQALTFDKIAPMSVGRIDMQYRRIACTPPNNMVVTIDQNRGNGGWIRLDVQQIADRASIQLVQIKGEDSDWTSLKNIWGATWELGWTPKVPLDVRIRQDDGQEVTAYQLITKSGITGALPTSVQFKIGNNFTAPQSAKPLGTCTCTDNPPASNYSCKQQKDYQHCDQSWMVKGDGNNPLGFCAKTCGRCNC
ncbi:hypothetical protein WJX72_003612 [[Myrmecia] bisecta]|uniref:Uncharacterized protein n=1 Tax=[Myrmecia] bisecta TaxID=41462 RepID=A0AAW1QEV7_9CHLO